jgi:outer membrane receptor protein involved in Fe transport
LFHFLNVKAGLRYEYTDTKIDFPNTEIPAYNTWAPSLLLMHELPNKQSIKFAYTHRIERPDYYDLNPFKNLSDPYNISTGNPLIKPEQGDNFELGYNKSYDKGANIYVALVTRINSEDMKRYTLFYPTYQIGDSLYKNVSVTSWTNIGYEVRSGVVLSVSIPIKDRWNIRLNTFISNRRIINELAGGTVTNGLDGRVNLNLTYQLPHNLIMEAFVNYNSPINNIQGKTPQYFSYNYALRKQFLDKKLSFGFTTTNPFNQYVKQVITTTTTDYVSTAIRYMPLRSFGISLQYKFGKLQFKKEEKDKDNLPSPADM